MMKKSNLKIIFILVTIIFFAAVQAHDQDSEVGNEEPDTHDPNEQITWEEFLEHFKSRDNIIPEMKHLRVHFADEEALVDTDVYTEILEKAIDGTFMGHESGLKDDLGDADHAGHSSKVRAMVRKYISVELLEREGKKDNFNLRSFYKDVIRGDFINWLQYYQGEGGVYEEEIAPPSDEDDYDDL